MHGLINRSIQCFVRDNYGATLWADVVALSGIGFDTFEPMLGYDDLLTEKVLDALCMTLEKPQPDVLEDVGTYLVSHENSGAVRRLLRFSGVSFVDFLHSLDDLNDRVRLAVPDLHLPELALRDHTARQFSLTCSWQHAGFGHVAIGMLRGMADDYGALVMLEHKGGQRGVEVIAIDVLETEFAEGRSFHLSGAAEVGHGR